MGKIAGIYYFDLRPVGASDEERVSAALQTKDRSAVRLHRRPGLLMGYIEPGKGTPAETMPAGWDGRLDNAGEVRRQYNLSQQSNEGALAAEAYRRHGCQGLIDLIGDWSLALWDTGSRSVILASDYAGIRPLYYHWGRDRLIWSSSLHDLVSWTGTNEIDDEYVALFLTQGHATGRTPYRGIFPVPPGHAVIACAAGVQDRPFWELPVHRRTRYSDERDYEEQLRLLFQEAVAARCDTGGAVCAELSGGLDSSSVVCVADRLKQTGGATYPGLVTFTYTCPESTDERYVTLVERACKTASMHFSLQEYAFVAANQAGKALPAWWQPRFRGIASRMAAIGSTVLLTGQLGDLIMGNTVDDSGQVADYLQGCQFLHAAREAFAWSQSLHVPIYAIFWRALRANCTAWAAPSIAESMCDRYGHIDSLSAEFRKRVVLSCDDRRYEPAWHAAPPGLRTLFRGLSEMLSARVLQAPELLEHISYAHPFAHRPLVEFMLTIPRRIVCRPGEPRRLMRRAFAGLLPADVLNRRSKAGYNRAYREALLPLAAEILRRPGDIRIVECRYVLRGSFIDRLRRFTEGLDCNESQLRQLILFEYWLRSSGQGGNSMLDEPALSWIN